MFTGIIPPRLRVTTPENCPINIIKKDVKDVEVQKTETGYVLTDKADRDTCYILTRTQLDDAFWNSCTADKKH